MEHAEEERRPSPRSDLISGGVWVVIGVAITVGSWRMDRLANQGVPPFAAPGLLPGILGVLIVLAALGIVWRALRQGALAAAGRGEPQPSHIGRAAVTLLLCLGFAGGLVGHGLPFWMSAAMYLFAHIAILQYPERRAAGQVGRGLVVAAAVALGASLVISSIFQYAFLVRLP
jgi:Tripartite tricarboxylate transporter TctB family